MPSLLDIRRRVRAVKSTQQITKAMKMVAASRLRRAQERIQAARPFAIEMLRVLNSLATRVDPSLHPLLDERRAPRAGGKTLLFVITADRGLCGSFNTNAVKGASQFIVENPAREVALGLVGRRGRDYFARRGFEVRYEQVNLFQALQYTHAQAIAQAAIVNRRIIEPPGGVSDDASTTHRVPAIVSCPPHVAACDSRRARLPSAHVHGNRRRHPPEHDDRIVSAAALVRRQHVGQAARHVHARRPLP